MLNSAINKNTATQIRKSPKSGKRKSLERVAKELAEGGYMTAKGNIFSASQVGRLLAS